MKRLLNQMFLIVFIIIMIFPGHAYCAEHQSKVVFVLFDISGSTKKEETRKQYVKDFKVILNSLNPGDIIVVDMITESSVTKSNPYSKELEKLSFLEGGPLKARILRKKNDKKKADVLEYVKEQILRKDRKVLYTDILSSLNIAERVFKSYEKDKYVLVIMSDMIEESRDYNFTKDNLSEKRIEEIITREKAKNRIPDLADVKVYVSGATASNSDRFFAIQNFWLRYFKECGANLSKENYGSVLLNFDE